MTPPQGRACVKYRCGRRALPARSGTRWTPSQTGIRFGVPIHVDQWEWHCHLHLASCRGKGGRGIAADFSTARAAFETAWLRLLPTLTESEFQEQRHQRAEYAREARDAVSQAASFAATEQLDAMSVQS